MCRLVICSHSLSCFLSESPPSFQCRPQGFWSRGLLINPPHSLSHSVLLSSLYTCRYTGIEPKWLYMSAHMHVHTNTQCQIVTLFFLPVWTFWYIFILFDKGMSLSIAAVLNVIFQTPQPRDLPNLVRKRLHLVQISLSQEILRMNKNSLRGGGVQRKCYLKMSKCHACAQQGWNFLWQKAQRSECQGHSQFCKWEIVCKLENEE